ncbi:hypothetical protein RW1_038_00060 [Rhodococcus wratislaviensis NBRC 100605]|uniref:Uncharacterized protein n=1 Tax=Rhodococcus wratislaviensis NBRC 100605 TaxID=1219028 RepID=X0PV72_RHOWR|nr:hypothetical protein RW1_038_00060 [Rhodococcus wratislaviensis NBRC 100605]
MTAADGSEWRTYGMFWTALIGGMTLLGAAVGNPYLGAFGGALAAGVVSLAATMIG